MKILFGKELEKITGGGILHYLTSCFTGSSKNTSKSTNNNPQFIKVGAEEVGYITKSGKLIW